MNVIVTIWRGAESVLTAVATDGELVADLKLLAQAKGYRVEIKEQSDGDRGYSKVRT